MVESGTYPKQRTLIATLGTVVKEAEEKQIKPPSVIVIGEVANLGRKLAWFKKPLPKGQSQSPSTRPAGQAEEAGELIRGKRRRPLLHSSHRNQGLKQSCARKKIHRRIAEGASGLCYFDEHQRRQVPLQRCRRPKANRQLARGLSEVVCYRCWSKNRRSHERIQSPRRFGSQKVQFEGLLEVLKGKRHHRQKNPHPTNQQRHPNLNRYHSKTWVLTWRKFTFTSQACPWMRN